MLHSVQVFHHLRLTLQYKFPPKGPVSPIFSAENMENLFLFSPLNTFEFFTLVLKFLVLLKSQLQAASDT